MRRCSTLLLAVVILSLGAACARPGSTPTTSDTQVTIDTHATHPTVWLCRPGMVDNPCEGGLDATVVESTGPAGTTDFQPAASPPVDCFYVYPTVSKVGLANAPLRATDNETAEVRAQAARFGQSCRVFAPLYQQYTIVSLLQKSGPSQQARQLAYADVRSAWHDYLVNDNDGRPVALIGQDQGAEHLARLLREDVEPVPAVRRLLVSAYLVGTNVLVTKGSDTGGDLTDTEACRRHDQFGCVVSFSAYATDPPVDAAFGRVSARDRTAGRQALCTNPAALGGEAAQLHPYLPTTHLGGGDLPGQPTDARPDESTGFVTYPRFLFGQCRTVGDRTWLTIQPWPAPGDVRRLPALDTSAAWGLHVDEFSLVLGDLVTLLGRQSAAYLAAGGRADPGLAG
jgi:hypothetical protein